MSPPKRPASDDGGQPVAKNTRILTTDSRLDQHEMTGPSNVAETSGDFKIEVKLRSTSKAARNDPVLILPQVEIYRELLTQGSNGGPEDAALFEEACLAVGNRSLDRGADESGNQAKSTIVNGNTGSPYEDNLLQKTTVGEGSVKSIDAEELRGDNIVIDEEDGGDEGNEEDEDDDEDNDDDGDDDGEDDEDEYEDRSDLDSNFEFEWLEPIDIEVSSTADLDEGGVPKKVAYCRAKLIRRSQICDEFYEQMEPPSKETSMLAFDLFDRYGRLRSEFKTHPVIKGTGVWSQELDHGDMLLIEEVFVKQDYRRQRLGQRMIESLLTLVRQKTSSFFAFVWPTFLKLHDLELEWDSLQDDAARNRMADREDDRAINFYRSLGFRRVGSTIWFALASDDGHPSHQLTSTEDFNSPKALLTALHPLLSPLQQIGNPPPSTLDQMLNPQPRENPDFLGVLHDCMQQKDSADACWRSRDKDCNTILHLAASISNVPCVEWILNQNFGTQLLQLRNNRGETPLEKLQFRLEKLRTKKVMNALTVCVSDKFNGHSDSAVRCLILLQGLESIESFVESQGPDALSQITGGCTCRRCLKGFLSPRMSHALLYQAEMGFGIMDQPHRRSWGPEWDISETFLGYLPSRVLENLKTNRSMRQGFMNLWLHIGSCLESGRVPNERNVLDIVRDAHEWPPVTNNFLQRRGTVESVFLAICRRAMDQDKWIEVGESQEDFTKHIVNLPECRNDLEFGYVSGMCGYRRIS